MKSSEKPPKRAGDRDPVDPYFAERVPRPAMTATGEMVPNAELEASAELIRFSKRLGWISPRIDGFLLYRLYRRLSARRRLDADRR